MATPITLITDRGTGRNVLLYDADGNPIYSINGALKVSATITLPIESDIIVEDALSGSTVDALTDVLVLDTRMIRNAAITFQNTGAASCILRITTRTKYGGSLSAIEVNDTTILSSGLFRYFSSKFLAEVTLSTRSAAVGVPTTWSIEYIYEKIH